MRQQDVDLLFERLLAGELPDAGMEPESGWEMTLPSGRTVLRSTLQAAARPLIEQGPEVVPMLFPWVMNDNLAARYVAIYALQRITGESPHIPYFDREDEQEYRSRAIDIWRRWYEATRTGAAPDAPRSP